LEDSVSLVTLFAMESKQKTPGKRGRQPDASSKSGQIRELLATNMSVKEIAEKLNCTPALVYNVKARMGGGGGGNKPRRGPGRPPKAAAAAKTSVSVAKLAEGGLEGIVAMVRQSETQRAQLRQALERIQAILADALR